MHFLPLDPCTSNLAASCTMNDPCLLLDEGADEELWPSIMRSIIPYTIRPGRDQNSELKVCFLLNVYYFCTKLEKPQVKLFCYHPC